MRQHTDRMCPASPGPLSDRARIAPLWRLLTLTHGRARPTLSALASLLAVSFTVQMQGLRRTTSHVAHGGGKKDGYLPRTAPVWKESNINLHNTNRFRKIHSLCLSSGLRHEPSRASRDLIHGSLQVLKLFTNDSPDLRLNHHAFQGLSDNAQPF